MRTALLSLLFLAGTTLNAQIVQKKILFFGYDKVELEQPTLEQMEYFYDIADDSTVVHYELLGLLNRHRTKDENNSILATRAEKVKAFFRGKGMSDEDFEVSTVEVNPMLLKEGKDRSGLKNFEIRVVLRKFIQPDVFETLAVLDPVLPQKKTVDPKKKIEITGKEGTVIKVKRKAFMFADGTVAEDPVKIELKEYYDVESWMSEGLVTTCNGQMIESGGMIHVSATCKGQEVMLRPGKNLDIAFPLKGKAKKAGMQTFVGQKQGDIINWVTPQMTAIAKQSELIVGEAEIDEASALDNQLNYNWNNNRNVNVVNERGSRGFMNKGNNELDNYMISSAKMGWINCDRFTDVEEKGNMLVQTDTAMHPVVRMVFQDINSMMPAYYDGKDGFNVNNIPVGQKAVVVAYTLKNKKPYMAMQDVTIADGKKVKLTLRPVTMEELKKAFADLDKRG